MSVYQSYSAQPYLFISGNFFIKQVDFENFKTKILSRQEAFRNNNLPRQLSYLFILLTIRKQISYW